MKDKIWIAAVTLMAALAVASVVRADVVFEDNFNSQADWQPSPGIDDASPGGAYSGCDSGDCTGQVPTGWSYYRATGLWWPSGYEETVNVNSDNARGGIGKSYTQWCVWRRMGCRWGFS